MDIVAHRRSFPMDDNTLLWHENNKTDNSAKSKRKSVDDSEGNYGIIGGLVSL